VADPSLWPLRMRLGEIQRRAPELELEADAAQREAIAGALDLLALERFSAAVSVKPWLDGAEIRARWQARVRQTCGVSLEAFDTDLSGTFTVRAVPADSPAAVDDEAEVAVDPDAEDPPDVLEGDEVDVGAYLVEHLALEIDPFPRKPGAAFEPPPEERPASPFAVLQALKPSPGEPE
jgi:uncharacterized metal-binding protein YceD (DUF177 family)